MCPAFVNFQRVGCLDREVVTRLSSLHALFCPTCCDEACGKSTTTTCRCGDYYLLYVTCSCLHSDPQLTGTAVDISLDACRLTERNASRMAVGGRLTVQKAAVADMTGA